MSAAVIIPFRDRGVDPCRRDNLERIVRHWESSPWPVIVADDGRGGSDQFNRHAAYNRGTAQTNAEVLVYIESDILIDYQQVEEAIKTAESHLGIVIPFTVQNKLSEMHSQLVRAGLRQPQEGIPEQVVRTGENGINHGCANVISRASLNRVGQWDERFEGHGHDDTAMLIAFDRCAGPWRFIDGVAYHLYHLDFDPTLTKGEHIKPSDAAAQERNLRRLSLYRQTTDPEAIRRLISGPRNDWRVRAMNENDPLAGRYRA